MEGGGEGAEDPEKEEERRIEKEESPPPPETCTGQAESGRYESDIQGHVPWFCGSRVGGGDPAHTGWGINTEENHWGGGEGTIGGGGRTIGGGGGVGNTMTHQQRTSS